VSESFDVIVGGTGFASTFFIHRYLSLKPDTRILVLERGGNPPYQWMLDNRQQSTIDPQSLFSTRGLGTKTWLCTIGMGGGSNCWWGQTPRFLPEDFELKSRFGVGHDWPFGYAELEPYYGQAEALMGIAGPSETPYPMSTAYPQPPHQLSSFDRRMIEVVGADNWIAAPTARSSTGTARRGKCCGNGVCGLCPVDAKFRVMNELADVYRHPGVVLKTGAEVRTVETRAGVATGVSWREGGEDRTASCDLVFLGLNGIFNPAVLLRSGDTHPLVGRRLHEQLGVKIVADLASTESFDGGSHITGLGYMFYAGEHRRTLGASILEHQNSPPLLRSENGKWRRRALLKVVSENLPEDRNTVSLSGDDVVATFVDHSEYAKNGISDAVRRLEGVLAGIGLEAFTVGQHELSEGHIHGTAVMARSPGEGVVDAGLVHHRIRNLVVGGAGSFPSSPPANPSLTIAALSLRAADALARGAST
jgi:choline dehydrogenase-like flavoprotein